MHREFKSEKYRLDVARKVRSGEIRLFEHLVFDAQSLYLKLDITMPIHPTVGIKNIFSRADNKTLVYKLKSSQHSVIMKIYPVDTQLSQEECKKKGILNHEIEVRYLKLFSELIQHSVCPHFALAFGHAILPYQAIQKWIPSDFKADTYMVLLGECGDTTLASLVTTTKLSLYCLGFLVLQVVLSLAIVQDIFESFRHNDLHLANVLIQDIQAEGFTRYDFHDQNYFHDVKNCPYRCLLWDMFYASIITDKVSDVEPARKTMFRSPNSRTCINKYLDLHKFFDSLECNLNSPHCATPFYDDIKLLIDLVVPPRLKNLTHEQRSKIKIWEIDIISPRQLLENPFFNTFRRDPNQESFLRIYQHPLRSEK